MRTLTQKYMGGFALKEDLYKADLAVLDRYQAFSSEMLRLALLGIAGYGFLISNVLFRGDGNGRYPYLDLLAQNRLVLIVGLLALATASATALGHRYFSTDCLTHFVRRLRLSQSLTDYPAAPEAKTWATIIDSEGKSLAKDLNICRWLLLASAVTLTVGAFAVSVAFALTLGSGAFAAS